MQRLRDKSSTCQILSEDSAHTLCRRYLGKRISHVHGGPDSVAGRLEHMERNHRRFIFWFYFCLPRFDEPAELDTSAEERLAIIKCVL
ncbi:hypothetical protein JTE90_003605 [Oedothorax gibbosus]|uniref:Uncharacterized protein n=1 Tax=Oedothorax gibbosus TaxID=931172 RepID=A0AAV6VDB1_9ARAC|nr:hypothetical protein JTE90_003605 [Oedothorax gibbosus]